LQYFARAGGGENAEFEGAGGNTFPLMQLAHERRKSP
jgi:hypothetical protein